jgi:hypothetical protein
MRFQFPKNALQEAAVAAAHTRVSRALEASAAARRSPVEGVLFL